MKTLFLSLNPFDILILIICIILIVKFVVQGLIGDEMGYVYAFMTLMSGIIYAKMAQISNEN